ncbi:MAG: diguanylate cyclase [Baekduia sp.]
MSDAPRRLFGDRIGSFRGRMRLFFFIVVLAPTVAVALVIFSLIESSERGQSDARLAARQGVAIRLAEEEQQRALRYARSLAREGRLADVVRNGDTSALDRLLDASVDRTDATRIAVDADGRTVSDTGAVEAMLPATVMLTDKGRKVARLRLSVTTADRFAAKLRRVTDEPFLIRDGAEPLAASSQRFVAAPADRNGTTQIAGESYHYSTFTLPSFDSGRLAVTGFEPASRTEEAITRSRWLAVFLLLGFVLLALVGGMIITRSLQHEIDTFLTAARRLGGGDFTAKIPTRGRDEFAQLGQEFNAMSDQLQAGLDDLRQERRQRASALQRLGQAFASNLDSTALLQIVVQTAVDTLGADGGRALVAPSPGRDPQPVAEVGAPDESRGAVAQAEEAVLERRMLIAVEDEDGHAMGYPLRAEDGDGQIAGVIVVWRKARPFTGNERDMFDYLASRAAVSVQNVGRHQVVAREAVTDALTGLPNRRRFDQRLAHEVEKARSVGSSIAVVMLDIDDFKKVNDTYGHQTGDDVLRGVADILLSASRDPDTPGRIGGEEMAVLLPGASAEGALEFAERVRSQVAELRFTAEDDPAAEPFAVTASLGVSAATGAVAHVQDLLAESDEALYAAKRAGKNRTMVAGRVSADDGGTQSR